MKKFIFLICLCFSTFVLCDGQINIGSKIKSKAKQKVDTKTNQAIDKGLNEAEEEITNILDPSEEKGNNEESENPVTVNETTKEVTGETKSMSEPLLLWEKYDFVPGDKIIFEDNLENEENGEFPSRWDFRSGNIEVAEFGGENVIMFRDGGPEIVPYMKEPGKDYLPQVFTIEFDLYVGNDNFYCYLFDRKNQKSGSPTGYTYISTRYYKMSLGQAVSELPEKDKLAKRRWVHVAIAYTNGKLKAYMDETRLINLPRLDFDPKGISLYCYHARNDNLYYVKNIRIAEGGVKYYDRVLQDGKIVTNGIRFDVNKAIIKPESMGVINSIYKLLNDNPDLKFSIEGHTDNDGDDQINQKLSEERAKAVLKKLCSMGIDQNRLGSKGFGESMPIDSNSTNEGKANNRRVEFVKM